MAHLFGPDTSVDLRFSSVLDPIGRSFSFSSLAGQTYLGQPILLTTSAVYNASLSRYEWSTSGSLGSSSYSGTGTVTWVGDPAGTDSSQVTLGGRVYQITSNLTYDIGPFGPGTSSGTYMFTGPPGGPGGPGPFGPYNGTDSFVAGHYQSTVIVPKNPIVPTGVIMFTNGNIPFPADGLPGGGLGNFDIRMAPIPEPRPFLSVVCGAVLLLRAGQRRRSAR